MSSQVPLLDTLYSVETPENIDLHADVAGPVVRVLAYSIDVAARIAVVGALWLGTLPFGHAGMGVWLLLSFGLEWFYPVLFEVYRSGQTPGKKALGLAVVHDDLTPVQWGPSLVRNLLRVVDFLPFSYFGGLVCMSSNRRFQRFGDLAAGTIVVHRALPAELPSMPDARPQAPPFALAPEDQIALINFTQRSGQLSTARQRELADILAPTCSPERRGDDAVQFWRGVGSWLLGSR